MDALILSKSPITQDVIKSLDRVKFILRVGTEFDNIDVKAATEHNIAVSNVPGLYCSEELAEHAIGLMIAAAREMTYFDSRIREPTGWNKGKNRHINSMNEGVFGIIGLGYIGRSVARQARGLGMDIIAYDPYLPTDLFDTLNVEFKSFDELLKSADCVSIHTPLTAETHQMLTGREFKLMKNDAVLVNTAHGPIVDEAALVAAVENNEIWGAGLDVFETEPPTNPPVFDCDRIICSPHRGGSSEESEERCIQIAREELRRFIEGEHLWNVVNPDVFKYKGGTIQSRT